MSTTSPNLANGSTLPSDPPSTSVHAILTALQAIHDPRSSNEIRQQATKFLDDQKAHVTANEDGFALASDQGQPTVVRYFGCSLMEHTIRYRWQHVSEPQRLSIQQQVLELAHNITQDDALFIRAKIATLWVELAKKSWGIEWMDMDSRLLDLWNRGDIYIDSVLAILEALSEDVFSRDDTAAATRGTELSSALVEIFTPAVRSSETDGKTKQGRAQRADDQGWLSRVSVLLTTMSHTQTREPGSRSRLVSALDTLRSVLSWVMLSAVISTGCFHSICVVLASQNDPTVSLAAVEALHSLYTRSHLTSEEFKALVLPMYEPGNVSLLTNLFQWSNVDAQDIDETRYALSKKFSELVSFLCGHIEEQPELVLQATDLSVFFQLTISILRHQSLFVSIPILHSWTKMLIFPAIGDSAPVWSVMELLLETACQRIMKYEALPEDSEEPSIVFLNEDISTVPERHAFLGNYRRFCHNVVEVISQRRPSEALQYIIAQADAEIERFSEIDASFQPAAFERNSLVLLQIDAHFTVVEAAVRGFGKWVSVPGRNPQEDEKIRIMIERKLDQWASSVLSRSFGNPLMKQRVIKLAIEISTRGLNQNEGFALRVLEHILVSQPSNKSEYAAYGDAVKELHIFATNELRKLAIRYADYFATFYDQLETKVNDILCTTSLDEKPRSELTGLLFIVMHRASDVDPEQRWHRLASFVDPIQRAWQNPSLTEDLSSFDTFCKMLDIDKVVAYLQSRNASRIEDWSSTPLDQAGLDLQKTLADGFHHEIPLRASKTLLAVSTENLRVDSQAYHIACKLWHDRIPAMLPNILSLVKQAHTFHDPNTWSAQSPELQHIFRRVLMDRFWQAGISTGTKDQFYAKITNTKTTLEGFGSSVRGKLRSIRESCYSLLFCMSRLGDYFYGFEELAQPLADALFGTAGNLSPHQFSILLNMSRYLIDDCPASHRAKFLPPLLSSLFTQVDRNIMAEWERIGGKRATNVAEDGLAEEMKEESVLRQFTYNAIMLVTNILDPNRDDDKNHTSVHRGVSHHHRRKSSQSYAEQAANFTAGSPTVLRTFVLSDPSVLEPILLFCTHALQVRDTRCASIITRVIRSVVPVFSQPASQTGISPEVAPMIREFIASSVLRTAITSFHDPYFVDLQKDLAQLIATIWTCYGIPHEIDGQPLTPTPQAVIMSLPGITEGQVQITAHKLAETASQRQQRAYVLELLEELRGLSINEMGKINPIRAASRSFVRQRYTSSSATGGDMEGLDQVKPVNVDDGPDLEGIAEIFG